MSRVTIVIIGLLTTALALYWQVQIKRGEKDAVAVSTVERPDFVANELRTIGFNKQGLLESKVTATHMEHYASTDITHFNEPVYVVYPKEGKANWTIRADKGQLNKSSDLIVLEKDVVIDSINIDEPIHTLRTQSLSINLKTLLGGSEDMVYVKGKGVIIQGLGLHVDLNAQELSLLSKVEGKYEPH